MRFRSFRVWLMQLLIQLVMVMAIKRWLLISERRYRKILKLQRICTAQISLAGAGKN